MASSEIDEILSGPLVQWFTSCLELTDSPINYNDLVDGVLLHRVFLQINPEPLYDDVVASEGNNAQRIRNLELIIGNMKQFYEEELGHLIMKEPDPTNLGKEPESHVRDARLLLLLLLGCAVQCPSKEHFITKIKTLHLETQLAIVDCIKQVTDQSDIVITQDSLENADITGVFQQIKNLLQERDLYKEKLRDIAFTDVLEAEEGKENPQIKSLGKLERERCHHHAVELADWKSKLRKERQKLDEKTEALVECKEELEQNKIALAKLKQENQELIHAARIAQSYRDELDAVNERAERADRLEVEVQRYRDKLTDMEFYKTRIEELREDNRVLIENREMLEEQLNLSRRSVEKVLELQAQINDYEQLINEMTLEQIADKEKYEKLFEENCELHRLKKAAADEAALAGLIGENEEPASADNSLSEQLTNIAQTRVLKLELENRRLMSIIDTLEENALKNTSSKFIDLQNKKDKLSLKIDSLTHSNENLSHENCDLELVCRDALEENKKLQSILENQRNSFTRKQQECQSQHTTILDLENKYDSIAKEKRRIQLLLDRSRAQIDDLNRTITASNQQLESLKNGQLFAKKMEAKCEKLEAALESLEKEKEAAQRDVYKQREIIEIKDVALDKSNNKAESLERRVMQLEEEMTTMINEISRLQGIEKLSKEKDSQARIDRETLETLKSNLVSEKMNTQKMYQIFEKLGLSVKMILKDPFDAILKRIATIPEVIDHVIKSSFVEETILKDPESRINDSDYVAAITKDLQEIIDSQKKEMENLSRKFSTMEETAEVLKSDKAKLQVSVTTLQSQIVSLTTQQTALQIVNCQLLTEKEEILKESLAKEEIHNRLVNDQITLQSLHEQLNNEYENILREREALKKDFRDAKNTARNFRENCQRLEMEKKNLTADNEVAINNANCLNNLRAEHSKLEDDFTNLYTTSEKLKMEYKNLNENYRMNKIETNRLRLKQTEIQGELNARKDKCAAMELEISKLNRCSEMLLQINSGLESNKRSLMDHLSLLFNQYHELLTHSFEDKEHYHMEEKLYTEKVNHLYRQKEKLEEKIMDHYKKMENCSTKKKKFGADFVKKVRKAGSEFLNKNRRSFIEGDKQLDDYKTYDFDSTENNSYVSIESQCDKESTIVQDKVNRWVIEKN